MKVSTFCLVTLFGQTLARENLCGVLLSYAQFGRRAWTYGLGPLWEQKKHHDQSHNTVNESIYAPVNELFVANTTHSPLWVSPNPSVLYASAHLDLSNDSVRLHVVPNIDSQFYSWQIMDAFTNSRWYISSTNNPNQTMPNSGDFAFVYKKCKTSGCKVPTDENITIIEIDTPIVWVVARYYVRDDGDDYIKKVRDVILNSTLGVETDYCPSKGNKGQYDRPGDAVQGLPIDDDPIQALDNLNKYITVNGWGPINSSTRSTLKCFGLYPGSNVVFKQLSNAIQNEILIGVKLANADVATGTLSTTTQCNGWRHVSSKDMGNYGSDSLLRSVVAYTGLGANIPSIGMYYGIRSTGLNQSLMSNGTYTITLPANWVLPPVNMDDELGSTNEMEHLPYNTPGFWSVTPYSKETGKLLNSKKSNVKYPNKDLVTNDKYETVIWLSPDNPNNLTVNWLPLLDSDDPPIEIYLYFRIYAAKQSLIEDDCSAYSINTLRIPSVVLVE